MCRLLFMMYRAALLLLLTSACGPDLSTLYEGPRGVRFNDYVDSQVYASATWLMTDAVLRIYDEPDFSALIVVTDTERSTYRDGLVEVWGAEACDRFISFAHNSAHIMRDTMEGDPDAEHRDARFFKADGSVEQSVRNTYCKDPEYLPPED